MPSVCVAAWSESLVILAPAPHEIPNVLCQLALKEGLPRLHIGHAHGIIAVLKVSRVLRFVRLKAICLVPVFVGVPPWLIRHFTVFVRRAKLGPHSDRPLIAYINF